MPARGSAIRVFLFPSCHRRVTSPRQLPKQSLQIPGRTIRSGGSHFIKRRNLAMARIIQTATGADALTFDDVLLQPGHSEVMPGQTNIATRIATDFELNIPIISSAMDTVTESRLAIAMAQAGG